VGHDASTPPRSTSKPIFRAHCERQYHPEQDNGGSIVEQALAFDEDSEPLGRAEALEERDYGDRIGRGDDAAEVAIAKSRTTTSSRCTRCSADSTDERPL
jgi:hypothetical protein